MEVADRTRWFADRSVGVKITLALAVAMLAGGVVAVAGLVGLSRANADAVTIYRDNMKPAQALAVAQGSFDDEVLALARAAAAASGTEATQQIATSTRAAGLVDDGVGAYAGLGLDPAATADHGDQAGTFRTGPGT